MQKKVIVINGRGGVGKDTCVDVVARKYVVLNCSSITPIKKAAEMLGWDYGDKSDKARKFLSDLKMASSEFNDFPFTYLLDKYRWFMETEGVDVMFVHIRELIKSNRTERDYGNLADDNVDNYDYDFVYRNDKPLYEVEADFLKFFEEQIFRGDST